MHTKDETTTPISVILPVYNESIDFLCKAIESVLNQTFQDFELIIIDDGSDSNSIEVAVKKYNDSRVKYIKKRTRLHRYIKSWTKYFNRSVYC